jgi:hypothetical protein
MGILAVRIRLPELDHAIRHRLTIGVQQSSVNRDALAFHRCRRKLAAIQPVKTNVKIRTDRL